MNDPLPGRRRIDFLDLPFDPLTLDEAQAWLAARDATQPFAYVVTPNVDHMVRLAKAPTEIVQAYGAADLVLCDSRVLARIAGMMGIVLPVAPGSDLVTRLFAEVLAPGDRICLIGGSDGGVARLRALHPAIDIRHHDAPPGLRTNPAARAEAVAFAIAAEARFTLIAVGSPQQEMIAHEMAESGAVRGTALCIGAAVDFIIGAQRRAPAIVQRASMEWAWRLGQSPRRLARRYLIDGPAIFALAWTWRKRSGKR
jgi:N-acetylglucosaminyldiphosphoundecaprenol N-acetyl-beta-D-mannosaminyltransferase